MKRKNSSSAKNADASAMSIPEVKISDLALFITLTATFLYTTGWAYARAYFDFFSVGLLGVDIPKEYFFQYGFQVARRFWGWLLLFYALGALRIWLREKIHPPEESQRWFRSTLFWTAVGGVILLFFLAIYWGGSHARSYFDDQKEKQFSDSPGVHVELNPKTGLKLDQLETLKQQALREGEYQLLFQSKTHLYLFRVPQPHDPRIQIPVLALPMREIHSFLLLPKRHQ